MAKLNHSKITQAQKIFASNPNINLQYETGVDTKRKIRGSNRIHVLKPNQSPRFVGLYSGIANINAIPKRENWFYGYALDSDFIDTLPVILTKRQIIARKTSENRKRKRKRNYAKRENEIIKIR